MAGAATDPGIALAPVRAFAEPPAIDDAADLLATAPLHAIAYGFFSSYVLDIENDRALQTRLEKRTRIPVVIPGLAAVRALRTLGVRQLALVDPPWFSAELSGLGAAHFRSQQIEVVYAAPATGLPIGQHDQNPRQLYEWVRAQVPATAEAVLTGGNGFRVVGAIEALEKDLGRPVLTANQVTFWNALRAAGVQLAVMHYRRIFAEPLQVD